MKSKQEPRAAAKQVPQSTKAKPSKQVTPSTAKKGSAPPASSKADFDDVADLFSAIRQTKANQKSSGDPTPSANGGKKNHASAARERSGAAPSSSPAVSGAEAKPVRDGLYHAPQKSVQMSDNQFFSGTWLKADQPAPPSSVVVAGSGESADVSEDLLRQEGVDRILSLEELSKMLSRGSRAGTTPNCPFDCDCCF